MIIFQEMLQAIFRTNACVTITVSWSEYTILPILTAKKIKTERIWNMSKVI